MNGSESGRPGVTPRVSIVTPAHNAARFLPEAYATVRQQSFTDWEWIVVDDASTDATRDLLEEWSEGDRRVRPLWRERSSGLPAAARNPGLAAARGELIALLDADDLWEKEKLERQVGYLDAHPDVGTVCTWYDTFGYEPWVRADHRAHRGAAVIERSDLLLGSGMQTSTLLFRRGVYEAIGGMDEDPRLVTGEDEEFCFRLTLAGGSRRIREVLTHYRLRPPGDSVTGRHHHAAGVRKLHLGDVYLEKGLISSSERRLLRSNAFYEQASLNLYRYRAPFRGLLVRSMLAGRPAAKAIVMLALSWLPAALLRPLLVGLARAVAALSRAGDVRR